MTKIEKKQVENIMTYLSKEEITSVVNSIYNLTKDGTISFNMLPESVRQVIKLFAEYTGEDRVYFMHDLVEIIEGLDQDVLLLARDVEKYISDTFYSAPLKDFNENNLVDRLGELEVQSEKNERKLHEDLFHLIGCINNKEEITEEQLKQYQAVVVGLAKTYERLVNAQKVEFLSVLRGEYNEEYGDVLGELIVSLMISEIPNILANASKELSRTYLTTYIEHTYYFIINSYNDYVKKEKMQNCEHEFGEWEDKSYQEKEYPFPELPSYSRDVNKILFSRKCKKCGLIEQQENVPEEYILERKEAERQQEIRILEQKLNILKGIKKQ